MRSLRARLVLSVALILATFLLLTSVALERAFADAARSAREERLLAQLYLLMAAAEVQDGRLVMPPSLAEPRLDYPGSGLSARIFDARGTAAWESRSAIDTTQPSSVKLAPGERRFMRQDMHGGTGYLVGAFGVSWLTGDIPLGYTFAVAEDLTAMRREVTQFRLGLWRWLGAMALLMLVALVITLRWGLRPLRRVAAEVSAVESGRQERLRGDYPTELRALTDNLNALLAQERARQQRLDHALGDLAHSLKTPLAVMEGAIVDSQDVDAKGVELLREQLARVRTIVEYQLQRARLGAVHAGKLAPSVPVRRAVERLAASLAKVYAEKGVAVELEIDQDLIFRGAESDLMEMLGNLLDNAYKWARTRVGVAASAGPGGLEIRVEDDGPGIGAAAGQLMERGFRADEKAPGHGLGLAVVREICSAYGGTLEIGHGPLGGAEVRLAFGRPESP
ncbi:MAG: ATP-binding protein [Chromatiaceae bacterium]